MDWYFKSYNNLIASSHKKLIFAWEILEVLFGGKRVNKWNLETIPYSKKTLNLMTPFYGWGLTASMLQPLRGGCLLFITKFKGFPGAHFINNGNMKGWVDLGATLWFLNTEPLDLEASVLIMSQLIFLLFSGCSQLHGISIYWLNRLGTHCSKWSKTYELLRPVYFPLLLVSKISLISLHSEICKPNKVR